MAEEEVPCYFLCPISLHIMLDPVTLPSGITYDREGIERWLLTAGTCPLTKQPVPADCEPTPNHTLRRLIQAWCKLHDVVPVVSPPTKNKPRTDRARVASLLSHIDDDDGDALRELREVAAESELNRKLISAVPGAVDALIAALTSSSSSAAAADGALEIVSSLELSSDQRLVRVVETNGAALVDALVSALQRCSSSREHAARFLAEATVAMSPTRLASLPDQVFREAVRLLRDRVSTKPALRVLVGATPWGRNRVKAVDAGAVAAVVDLLLDSSPEQQQQRRSACELALGALERMCGCAEGRAELVAHAAGVAAVGNVALLGVSDVATDRAVRVVRAVARHAATPAVLHEMLQSGVVAALCVVAHSSERFGERTRERARETLRMHVRAWRNSPCLHRHLQAMYPAC